MVVGPGAFIERLQVANLADVAADDATLAAGVRAVPPGSHRTRHRTRGDALAAEATGRRSRHDRPLR